MKKKGLKTALAAAALGLTIGASAIFGGCFGANGRDGVDGKDLNIYDLYEAAKTETNRPDLTMDEFLKEYLSYDDKTISQATSLKAAINRSLLSSVSILSGFQEYDNGSSAYKMYDGSGVIIDIDTQSGDMLVVTNCHVVYSPKADYSKQDGYSNDIKLWLYGSEFMENNAISAEILAASRTYDLAVLRVKGSETVKKSKAVAASWESAEDNFIGETVYAVGNAYGEKTSATLGIISKDYDHITTSIGSTEYKFNVIRMSAAINSGNSGGGLFNAEGKLVGVVNAKSHESLNGVGYALPAAACRRIVKRMLDDDKGEEVHGVRTLNHGIFTDVTDSYTTGIGEDGVANIVEIVKVTNTVIIGAVSGKFENGDVIRKISVQRGGEKVEEMQITRTYHFDNVLLSVAPNDTVIFEIERGGAPMEVSVKFNDDTTNFPLVDALRQ